MSTLERAVAIAAEAHTGQVDKAGAPYLLHPLRVMQAVLHAGHSYETAAVAVLHDVVEDCPEWTLARLAREGFSTPILAGVEALTRRKDEGESYEAFIERCGAYPPARAVKLADLRDNLRPVSNPRDQARQERYRRAITTLLETEP